MTDLLLCVLAAAALGALLGWAAERYEKRVR